MGLLFLGAFAGMMASMAAVFVALVAHRHRRERARRSSWSTVAGRLRLRYEAGDPLALADRLGVTRVSETLWGALDGAQVAAVTATVFRPSGSSLGTGPALSTFSAAVAHVEPPARFDRRAVAAWFGDEPEPERIHVEVSPTGDLALLVAARTGWRPLHDPDDAATIEWLLHQAALVARATTATTR
jgi:hypothetical protein